MKLLFALLLASVAQGQDTIPSVKLGTGIGVADDDSIAATLFRGIVSKPRTDTIFGALQVIEWEKEYQVNFNTCSIPGCLVYHYPLFETRKRMQVSWITGYEIIQYAPGLYTRYLSDFTYLTADKQPLDKKYTVVQFIKKPE